MEEFQTHFINVMRILPAPGESLQPPHSEFNPYFDSHTIRARKLHKLARQSTNCAARQSTNIILLSSQQYKIV